MKKLFLILVLLGALAGSGASCHSPTVTDVIYKSEGALITSVDSIMQAWSDYVKSGQATQSQVDTVKKAYNTYRNAQILARVAVDSYFAAGSTPEKEAAVLDATKTVSTAKNALIDLVTTLIHK